jgi:hypothetical protein
MIFQSLRFRLTTSNQAHPAINCSLLQLLPYKPISGCHFVIRNNIFSHTKEKALFCKSFTTLKKYTT